MELEARGQHQLAAEGTSDGPRERANNEQSHRHMYDACMPVCKYLHKPLPCSPAAETALQPLIRCSESSTSRGSSSPEKCFFTGTGISILTLCLQVMQAFMNVLLFLDAWFVMSGFLGSGDRGGISRGCGSAQSGKALAPFEGSPPAS